MFCVKANKLFEKKKIGHERGKTFAVNSPVITTLSATRKVNKTNKRINMNDYRLPFKLKFQG